MITYVFTNSDFIPPAIENFIFLTSLVSDYVSFITESVMFPLVFYDISMFYLTDTVKSVLEYGAMSREIF